ncbi:MAG: rhomboid family intramembrane serine protease [Candidatus Hydrogenedentes bacterium]|nr:rhomboid family intramembrane serine protease [Candidatus Hydrogenedentota bacterium]
MQLPPGLKKFLDAVGINTTQLQWKLYHWEKRWKSGGLRPRLPTWLHWWNYPHKFCFKCGALVDRDARTCATCNARLPSFTAYRLFRLVGLSTPGTGLSTINVFLAIILALYMLSVWAGGAAELIAPSGRTLIIFGAWSPDLVTEAGQYWRLLSCGLIHIGLIHILFNCLALTQIGPVIEEQIGRARTLVVITLTQLTSALGSHLWYSHGISAGASGWLFGLLGFGIGYYRFLRGSGRVYRDFLVRWAIYGILFGLVIGANNAAHVGGMLGGILLGLAPTEHPHRERFWNRIWATAACLSLATWLVTLIFLARSILFFTGQE